MRQAWQDSLAHVKAHDLVFLDECGSNIALAPAYGRAPRGQRAWGHAPKNRGRNTTILGALSAGGWQVGMVLEGAADTLAFEVFIEHSLLPTLRLGQIIVLDNLSIHKSATVRRLLEEAQCWLAFLPTYSADFNPHPEGTRTRLEQAQNILEESGGQNTRGTGTRHRSRSRHHLPQRCL